MRNVDTFPITTTALYLLYDCMLLYRQFHLHNHFSCICLLYFFHHQACLHLSLFSTLFGLQKLSYYIPTADHKTPSATTCPKFSPIFGPFLFMNIQKMRFPLLCYNPNFPYKKNSSSWLQSNIISLYSSQHNRPRPSMIMFYAYHLPSFYLYQKPHNFKLRSHFVK